MRHHNCTWRSHSTAFHRVGDTIYKPYNHGDRTYSSPTANRRYVKIIQFLLDHPGSRRPAIYEAVFGGKYSPGSQSQIFSELLYDDLIDYNPRTYEYVATLRGVSVLKRGYRNTLRRMVRRPGAEDGPIARGLREVLERLDKEVKA